MRKGRAERPLTITMPESIDPLGRWRPRGERRDAGRGADDRI